MEANKLDALECIRRAEDIMRSDNFSKKRERVIELLQKSIRLYPTEKAQELLEGLMSAKPKELYNDRFSEDSYSGDDIDMDNVNKCRSRHRHCDNNNNESSLPGRGVDQKSAMKMVRDAKTLYMMLGVPMTASNSEISKAYKRLALFLHPDKNRVVGAAESFKAIAKAFKILSDPKLRSQYDASLSAPRDGMHTLYSESPTEGSRYGTRNGIYYNGNLFNVWGNDDDDFSAEDFFNAFFGVQNSYVSRAQSNATYRANVFRRNNPQRQEEVYMIRYVWMAVLMIFMILATFLTPEQPFRFEKSPTHYVKRVSSRLGLAYFVKPQFSVQANDLTDFEKRVESAGIIYVEDRCQDELKSYYLRARLSGKRDIEQDPSRVSTPSCDLYRRLMSRAAETVH